MTDKLEELIEALENPGVRTGPIVYPEEWPLSVDDELVAAANTERWPRVAYLALLLEDTDNRRLVDTLLRTVAERFAGQSTAALARNLQALILIGRGEHGVAKSMLEDAYFDKTAADYVTPALIAGNLATLAERNGAVAEARLWSDRASVPRMSGHPRRDAFEELLAQIDHVHQTVDKVDQTQIKIELRHAKRRTNEVVRRWGGQSVEAALAVGYFAHAKFRYAHRGDDRAAMDKALMVLETVTVLLGTRLGAEDARTRDLRVVTQLCQFERAVASEDVDRVRKAYKEVTHLRARSLHVRLNDVPRQLLITANEMVAYVEVARLSESVRMLRGAVSQLREVTAEIVRHFGARHPQAITAQLNLGCAQLDLACQERSADELETARQDLEQAARYAEAEYAEGHPARAMAAHQLTLCRRLGSGGFEAEGGGGLATKVRTRLDLGDEGWNTTYADYGQVGLESETEFAESAPSSSRPAMDVVLRSVLRLVPRLDVGNWSGEDVTRILRRLDRDQVDAVVIEAPALPSVATRHEYLGLEIWLTPAETSTANQRMLTGAFSAVVSDALHELGSHVEFGGENGPWMRWGFGPLTIEIRQDRDTRRIALRLLNSEVLRWTTRIDGLARGAAPTWVSGTGAPTRSPSPTEMPDFTDRLERVLRELALDLPAFGHTAEIILYNKSSIDSFVAARLGVLSVGLVARFGVADSPSHEAFRKWGFTVRPESGRGSRALGFDDQATPVLAARMMTNGLRQFGISDPGDIRYTAKIDEEKRIYLPFLGIPVVGQSS